MTYRSLESAIKEVVQEAAMAASTTNANSKHNKTHTNNKRSHAKKDTVLNKNGMPQGSGYGDYEEGGKNKSSWMHEAHSENDDSPIDPKDKPKKGQKVLREKPKFGDKDKDKDKKPDDGNSDHSDDHSNTDDANKEDPTDATDGTGKKKDKVQRGDDGEPEGICDCSGKRDNVTLHPPMQEASAKRLNDYIYGQGKFRKGAFVDGMDASKDGSPEGQRRFRNRTRGHATAWNKLSGGAKVAATNEDSDLTRFNSMFRHKRKKKGAYIDPGVKKPLEEGAFKKDDRGLLPAKGTKRTANSIKGAHGRRHAGASALHNVGRNGLGYAAAGNYGLSAYHYATGRPDLGAVSMGAATSSSVLHGVLHNKDGKKDTDEFLASKSSRTGRLGKAAAYMKVRSKRKDGIHEARAPDFRHDFDSAASRHLGYESNLLGKKHYNAAQDAFQSGGHPALKSYIRDNGLARKAKLKDYISEGFSEPVEEQSMAVALAGGALIGAAAAVKRLKKGGAMKPHYAGLKAPKRQKAKDISAKLPSKIVKSAPPKDPRLQVHKDATPHTHVAARNARFAKLGILKPGSHGIGGKITRDRNSNISEQHYSHLTKLHNSGATDGELKAAHVRLKAQYPVYHPKTGHMIRKPVGAHFMQHVAESRAARRKKSDQNLMDIIKKINPNHKPDDPTIGIKGSPGSAAGMHKGPLTKTQKYFRRGSK